MLSQKRETGRYSQVAGGVCGKSSHTREPTQSEHPQCVGLGSPTSCIWQARCKDPIHLSEPTDNGQANQQGQWLLQWKKGGSPTLVLHGPLGLQPVDLGLPSSRCWRGCELLTGCPTAQWAHSELTRPSLRWWARLCRTRCLVRVLGLKGFEPFGHAVMPSAPSMQQASLLGWCLIQCAYLGTPRVSIKGVSGRSLRSVQPVRNQSAFIRAILSTGTRTPPYTTVFGA
jgi:hypothetical protein